MDEESSAEVNQKQDKEKKSFWDLEKDKILLTVFAIACIGEIHLNLLTHKIDSPDDLFLAQKEATSRVQDFQEFNVLKKPEDFIQTVSDIKYQYPSKKDSDK